MDQAETLAAATGVPPLKNAEAGQCDCGNPAGPHPVHTVAIAPLGVVPITPEEKAAVASFAANQMADTIKTGGMPSPQPTISGVGISPGAAPVRTMEERMQQLEADVKSALEILEVFGAAGIPCDQNGKVLTQAEIDAAHARDREAARQRQLHHANETIYKQRLVIKMIRTLLDELNPPGPVQNSPHPLMDNTVQEYMQTVGPRVDTESAKNMSIY